MKHQSERQRKQFKKQQDEWMKQLEQLREMRGTPADL